jgi:flagellar hook assembly protein FlgD
MFSSQDEPVASDAGLRASPNPASGTTHIHVETRHEGRVRVSVYDVTGRRIRGLSDRILRAGGHQFSWDGRDESGREVASGIYLVRIATAERSRAIRLVRVR